MHDHEPPKPTLLDIPDHLLLGNVPMTAGMVCRLNLVSKRFSLFNRSAVHRNSYDLLNCVDKANWDKAMQLAQDYPDAILTEVRFERVNGVVDYVSPLTLAYKLLDATLLEFFVDVVSRLLPHQVKRMKLQLDSITPLPWRSLELAYQQYECKHHLWRASKATDDERLLAWNHLVRVQQDMLPAHVFRAWISRSNAMAGGTVYDISKKLTYVHTEIVDQPNLLQSRLLLKALMATFIVTLDQCGSVGGHSIIKENGKELLALFSLCEGSALRLKDIHQIDLEYSSSKYK